MLVVYVTHFLKLHYYRTSSNKPRLLIDAAFLSIHIEISTTL